MLEQTAREVLTILQSVHQPAGFKDSKWTVIRDVFGISAQDSSSI